MAGMLGWGGGCKRPGSSCANERFVPNDGLSQGGHVSAQIVVVEAVVGRGAHIERERRGTAPPLRTALIPHVDNRPISNCMRN